VNQRSDVFPGRQNGAKDDLGNGEEELGEVVDPEALERDEWGCKGKVVVVTGAAGGIGRAIVDLLTRIGMRVVATDLSKVSLEELYSDKEGVVSVAGDITDTRHIGVCVETAVGWNGELFAWVNNAGIFPFSPALEITDEEWDRTISVNLDSVFLASRAAGRQMVKQGMGCIVNMCSSAGYKARPNRAHYSVSKAAVEHLTHCLAVELGPYGVRVNGVAPGYIHTVMTDWVRSNEDLFESVIATIPLRCIGRPGDVADAVLFLISDRSSYVNGHVLAVDGGMRYV